LLRSDLKYGREIEGIVNSDNVLQTDVVIPAGWGVFYPTDLNECGDLRGHPRKQKPALKKSGLFWSARGDQAKTAV
jgi:hypothetical protein